MLYQNISIGDTVTNDKIIEVFKCGNMGGMRRSHTTNTLVIISDYTKKLYEDKWFGDELHYTGMGKNGDQSLTFQQNKTLAESSSSGVETHLFEVLIPKQYIYRGRVKLCKQPYKETQPGEDNKDREVWIFPLKLEDSTEILDNDILIKHHELKQKQAKKLSDEELRKRVQQNNSQNINSRATKSTTYIRDVHVIEYTKRRANGACQLCSSPAPFTDKEGNPFLECHHIEWLSTGGLDAIDNTVALCPNCHRKMHILNLEADKKTLKEAITRTIGAVEV